MYLYLITLLRLMILFHYIYIIHLFINTIPSSHLTLRNILYELIYG